MDLSVIVIGFCAWAAREYYTHVKGSRAKIILEIADVKKEIAEIREQLVELRTIVRQENEKRAYRKIS